jgi:hypothetical protein
MEPETPQTRHTARTPGSLPPLVSPPGHQGSYDERLRRLVYQAWELRASPYYRDALQAIIDLHAASLDRRYLDGEKGTT